MSTLGEIKLDLVASLLHLLWILFFMSSFKVDEGTHILLVLHPQMLHLDQNQMCLARKPEGYAPGITEFVDSMEGCSSGRSCGDGRGIILDLGRCNFSAQNLWRCNFGAQIPRRCNFGS